MTDGQYEFEGAPENTIEDGVFDEFVEDIRRWRLHADLDEKADDADLLAKFIDIGKVMTMVADRQNA